MANASAKPAAAKAGKPALRDLSDAELADEHRGLGFAKRRAEAGIKEIEAEVERRKLTGAIRGRLGLLERKPTVLLDLKRLREERPDIVAAFALGEGSYFSSRTLTAEERQEAERQP